MNNMGNLYTFNEKQLKNQYIAKLEAELEHLQSENEKLKNKIEYIRKRYPEIDVLEQALKGD